MEFETDQTLLRRFHDCADQPAFAELVRRYAGLVHAAALRQLGRMDQHLAEDVTQAVFQVLACKAHVAMTRRSLASWLLTVTRCAAIDAVRRNTAHRRREQIAARPEVEMDTSLTTEASSAEWDRIAPLLDAAMAEMPERDRDAVVMRYFQDMSFADIARSLEVSESAARKRVEKAIEKLRETLATRGITMNAAAIGSLLTVHAVGLSPPASVLAAAISAPATASVGLSSIAKGAITMMAWTKAKLVAGLAAAVLLLSVGGVMLLNRANAQEPPLASTAAPSTTAPDQLLRQFERDYTLADDEVIRIIDAPFPEGRTAWADQQHPYAGGAINIRSLSVSQRGKNLERGYASYGDMRLTDIVFIGMDEPWYCVEGVEQVQWQEINADVVIRRDAPLKARLDALAKIIAQRTNRQIAFVDRTKIRPCIVLRGQGGISKGPGDRMGTVVLTQEPLDADAVAALGQARPANAAWYSRLDDASKHLAAPFFNEEDAGGKFRANNHFIIAADAHLDPDDAQHENKLRRVLDSIQKQVGGEWLIEHREIESFALQRD